MTQRKKATRPKAPPRVKASSEAQQALAEVADELAALDASEVLRVNVDVARAVSIVLGAEPQLLAFKEEIERALPEHDASRLTRLRTYALAALYAHLDAQPTPPRSDLSDLIQQSTALKQTLIIAADGLAHAGLVDGTRLAEIKSGSGHLDLATDLVALGALFDVSWPQIEGKTFVPYADVEQASRLGTALMVALGAKGHPASRVSSEAVDRKHRAFTLLFQVYDEARRALGYLRWHEDDVDLIAPSLYKRARRRVKEVEQADGVEEVEDVAGDEPSDDVEEVEEAKEVEETEPGVEEAAVG